MTGYSVFDLTQRVQDHSAENVRLRADVRDLQAELARLKACPCHAESRACLLCGRTEPCGLLPPGGVEGDAPVCTMEPETYAELVARIRGAYDAARKLRARVAELEARGT